MHSPSDPKNFLSIDIGGSHIKATVLDREGNTVKEYEKVQTPSPASPENMMEAIKKLLKDFPAYDVISTGFPGYVKEGVVYTAPNLGTDLWKNTNLRKLLKDTLGKDAIVVNDADMQGMGVVEGKGFEMVITLGTGFGTSFFKNGVLLPHLELASSDHQKKYLRQLSGRPRLERYWNRPLEQTCKKGIRNFKNSFQL